MTVLSQAIDRSEYPFESKWMQLDAGQMHYIDEGSGEPIVLVHGTPTWSFEWRHLIKALSDMAISLNGPDSARSTIADAAADGQASRDVLRRNR